MAVPREFRRGPCLRPAGVTEELREGLMGDAASDKGASGRTTRVSQAVKPMSEEQRETGPMEA